jgi:hypothetical protein
MKVRSEAVPTGMDTRRIWLFFRQRDGRILQAYLTVEESDGAQRSRMPVCAAAVEAS